MSSSLGTSISSVGCGSIETVLTVLDGADNVDRATARTSFAIALPNAHRDPMAFKKPILSLTRSRAISKA